MSVKGLYRCALGPMPYINTFSGVTASFAMSCQVTPTAVMGSVKKKQNNKLYLRERILDLTPVSQPYNVLINLFSCIINLVFIANCGIYQREGLPPKH
ncbi:hypothetical protein GCM10007932_47360 [Vibrio penaeicida]|uniref:Uncharacterized protein n=1 Tax=Vibrio penaeicida TaxID=104609 RepID=A0AAV5NYI9_9VIBR|nr:hypothetical protein GCM10007932_47360 [Vibrio penaeicida]